MPTIDDKGRAVYTLLVTAFGVIRAVRTWLPVWTSMILHRVRDRLWETTWLLIAPLAIYGFIAWNSFKPLSPDPASQSVIQTNIALCLLGLFMIALRNSWNLIFETSFQRKADDLKPG